MTWTIYIQLPQVLAVFLSGWLLLRFIRSSLDEVIK